MSIQDVSRTIPTLSVVGCADRRADLLSYHGKRLVLDLGLSQPVSVEVVPDLVGMKGGYMTLPDGSHKVYIADQCQALTATLAHELRHAYQAENNSQGEYQWQVAYAKRKHEVDATTYATSYVAAL